MLVLLKILWGGDSETYFLHRTSPLFSLIIHPYSQKTAFGRFLQIGVGALKTWKEFTKDICDDPKVTGATPEQRHLACRHPANDLNEGALGHLQREYRAYPNITFGMVNAKMPCK
jgi:hypothetical protein